MRLRRLVTMRGLERRGGEDFKGREKSTKWWSDTGSGVTERAEVPQDLVNIRSSWFPALCVGGEGDSVKSMVAKSWLVQVSATSLAGC